MTTTNRVPIELARRIVGCLPLRPSLDLWQAALDAHLDELAALVPIPKAARDDLARLRGENEELGQRGEYLKTELKRAEADIKRMGENNVEMSRERQRARKEAKRWEREAMRLKAELDARPAPCVVLPEVTEEDVDAASRAFRNAPFFRPILNAYRTRLAERLPAWDRVEPGTVIKAGTRYRVEYVAVYDFRVPDCERYFIDRRTVPADPDAELVDAIARAACAEYDDDLDAMDADSKALNRRTASAILAAIREAHVIEPKGGSREA